MGGHETKQLRTTNDTDGTDNTIHDGLGFDFIRDIREIRG